MFTSSFASAMMGETSERAGNAVIQFHEDHFIYDPERRAFFLDEPDTLLGDRLDRRTVTEHRVAEGWTSIATVTLDNAPVLGVIDLWSRVDEVD